MKANQKLVLVIILCVGIALRVYFLFNHELIDAKEHFIFLSDEGIVGLMAKHIASGTNLPLFFYGQNYLGAFEAYVVALLFGLFGISVLTLKMAPAVFSVTLLFIVYLLAKKLFNARVAILSTLLVAIPSPYFFAWGLKARGGFIEYVVFSLLILLVFALIYFYRKSSLFLYASLGFLSGVTLWINQLVIPYLAVLMVLLYLHRGILLDKAKLLVLLLLFVLGASPLIAGNIQEPLGTAKILFIKQFKVRRDIGRLDTQARIGTIAQGLYTRLMQLPSGMLQSVSILFGKNETWTDESAIPQTTRIENLPRVPRWLWLVPLFFGCALLGLFYQKVKTRIIPLMTGKSTSMKDLDSTDLLIILFSVSLLPYFSPRFLLLCYPLAAILAAAYLDNLKGNIAKISYTALLVATVSLNAYGIADLLLNQRDESMAKLINALDARNCSHGYSSGPMYQIAFLSLEKTVFVPIDSASRYPRHEAEVGSAPNICYVFSPDQVGQKNHRAFTKLLEQEKIGYGETTVNGDTVYHIYYSLTPRERIPSNVRERLKIIRRSLPQIDADVPNQTHDPRAL